MEMVKTGFMGPEAFQSDPHFLSLNFLKEIFQEIVMINIQELKLSSKTSD